MKTISLPSPYAIDHFAEKNRKHSRHTGHNVNIALKKRLFLSIKHDKIQLLNISTRGAAIRCPALITKDSLLYFKVTFDGKIHYFLKGKVIRIQKLNSNGLDGNMSIFNRLFNKQTTLFQYGIQFEEPCPEFADHLVKTVLRQKLVYNCV